MTKCLFGEGLKRTPTFGILASVKLWAILSAIGLAWVGSLGTAAANTVPVAVFDIQVIDVPNFESGKMEKFNRLLEQAVSQSGYATVPRSDIKSKLQKLKAKSFDACYDESCQIEIGKELAAQKSVSATWTQVGGTCQLLVKLYDLRKAYSEFSNSILAACTETGLAKAFEKVRLQLAYHRQGQKKVMAGRDLDLTPKQEVWRPEASTKKVVVKFSSSPPGAMVRVDGKLIWQNSADEGCARAVEVGVHEISMEKERYLLRKEKVTITDGSPIHWALEADFGLLNVVTKPSGQNVSINGRRVGPTPLQNHQLIPGTYKVRILSECFYEQGKEISLARNQKRDLGFDLQPIIGALDISARDSKGNDLVANIELDGKKQGQTPAVIEASVCAKALKLSLDDFEPWSQSLAVQAKKTLKIDAELRAAEPVSYSSAPKIEKEKPKSGAPWLVTIAGGIMTLAGVVFGVDAVEGYEAGTLTQSEARKQALVSDGLMIGGGVTFSAGLLWGLLR